MQLPPTNLSDPIAIGPLVLPNRVFLAPMSGVTDVPFRQRAAAHGAGMVVSEMIASGELVRDRPESARRLERIDGVAHVVQLAGRDAAAMAEAAKIAEGEGADLVDINMGCPAKKVTGGYCGSALMRDLRHALALIEAVVGAVKVPVSVKMRLGWDVDCINAPELAARAASAGVAMITVHGRTRSQFYTGAADRAAIRAVTETVAIPVVVNGDIHSRADAETALALSAAAAVMVGRGHYGRPWLAGAIADPRRAIVPGFAALGGYVREHHEAMLIHYGRERGLRHARKHLGWYVDLHASQTDDAARAALMTATDPAVVTALIDDIFANDGLLEPLEDAA